MGKEELEAVRSTRKRTVAGRRRDQVKVLQEIEISVFACG